jgi:hypothetical protein
MIALRRPFTRSLLLSSLMPFLGPPQTTRQKRSTPLACQLAQHLDQVLERAPEPVHRPRRHPRRALNRAHAQFKEFLVCQYLERADALDSQNQSVFGSAFDQPLSFERKRLDCQSSLKDLFLPYSNLRMCKYLDHRFDHQDIFLECVST